jgi:hypothetical protein
MKMAAGLVCAALAFGFLAWALCYAAAHADEIAEEEARRRFDLDLEYSEWLQ